MKTINSLLGVIVFSLLLFHKVMDNESIFKSSKFRYHPLVLISPSILYYIRTQSTETTKFYKIRFGEGKTDKS